jgi:HK97 family phage major capsid protein
MITAGPTLGWLGEGEAKAVSDIDLERSTIHMKKVAVIIPWTDELASDSFLSIPDMVRQAIARAAAQEIDSRLWNGAGGTDVSPLGLLQGGTFQTVTHTSAATVDLDLERMILSLRVANFEPSAFVMTPASLHLIQTLKDLDGKARYPEARTPGAPSFMGVPIRTTNNLPRTSTTDGEESPIILAKWSEVEVYLAPSSFAISDVATVQDGGTRLDLWQRDMTAIRYVAHVSDVRVVHGDAVCVMDSVETQLP